MAKIVWIASYPKSGNTWLRHLVGNLVYGAVDSSSRIDEQIPDLHQGVTAEHLLGGQATFIKSHWMYRDDLPLREDTIGALYVYRHPLQVIASNLHYFLLNAGEGYFHAPEAVQEKIRNEYVDRFIEHGGDPRWVAQGIGSWAENVSSWIGGKVPYPCLHVSYESLKEDPVPFVRSLCEFLHLRRTAAEVERAVERSSFRSMREMEERESASGTKGGFTGAGQEAGRARGLRFMHQGSIDGYRSVLCADRIARAAERFGPLMERLGYRA